MTAPATLVLTAHEVGALAPPDLDELLAAAQQAGVDEVVVEVDEVPEDLAGACTRLGLRLLIGITCFHEHGAVTLEAHPELWPLGSDGRPRPRLEWYVGLVPSSSWVREEIRHRATRLAAHPAVAGVVLDFIRWPLHWELECRSRGPLTPPTSFDPTTRALFEQQRGHELALDPTRTTGVAAEHDQEWVRFRCDLITGLVTELADAVRAEGGTLGAFVVPLADAERRVLVGQDVAAWPVDTLYPMTYHAILEQPTRWIGDIARELAATATAAVVPVVQLTADAAWAQEADWGLPFGERDLGDAVASALADGSRVALFPGSAFTAGRRETVRRHLRRDASGA